MDETERKYVRHGRTHRRFDLQFPVRMRLRSGDTRMEIEGVSKNISIGGLLVRTAFAIPEQTSVSFVISLHGRDAVRPVHLMGEGEVVRLVEYAGIYLMAVRCSEPIVHLEEFLRDNNEAAPAERA